MSLNKVHLVALTLLAVGAAETLLPNRMLTAVADEKPARKEVAEDARMFTIQFRIVEDGETGERTLSEPQLASREGQQASLSVGQSVDDGAGGSVLAGFEVSANVRAVDGGKLRLDARVERTVNNGAAKGDLSIQGASVRISRSIRLDEKISLEMANPDKQGGRIRIHLSVNEADRLGRGN